MSRPTGPSGPRPGGPTGPSPGGTPPPSGPPTPPRPVKFTGRLAAAVWWLFGGWLA